MFVLLWNKHRNKLPLVNCWLSVFGFCERQRGEGTNTHTHTQTLAPGQTEAMLRSCLAVTRVPMTCRNRNRTAFPRNRVAGTGHFGAEKARKYSRLNAECRTRQGSVWASCFVGIQAPLHPAVCCNGKHKVPLSASEGKHTCWIQVHKNVHPTPSA